MSKFYVGQKIKKVRGNCNIGLEATVLAVGLNGNFYDMEVRVENCLGFIDAGHVGLDDSSLWEPILDADDGITDEVRKELDRILSHEREGVAA